MVNELWPPLGISCLSLSTGSLTELITVQKSTAVAQSGREMRKVNCVVVYSTYSNTQSNSQSSNYFFYVTCDYNIISININYYMICLIVLRIYRKGRPVYIITPFCLLQDRIDPSYSNTTNSQCNSQLQNYLLYYYISYYIISCYFTMDSLSLHLVLHYLLMNRIIF